MAEGDSGVKADQEKDVVALEEIRDTLGRFVLRAGYGGERIVITYHGERRAALVGMKDLERLLALDAA